MRGTNGMMLDGMHYKEHAPYQWLYKSVNSDAGHICV